MWREIFQRETYIGKMRVNRKLRILHEGVTCLDAKVIDLRPTTRRFVHFTMHPEYILVQAIPISIGMVCRWNLI